MEIINTIETTLNDINGTTWINNVKIEGAQTISINNGSGNVSVTGDVTTINTASGDVTCKDVKGGVLTMSGDVTCGNVGGNVSTMSGNIYHN